MEFCYCLSILCFLLFSSVIHGSEEKIEDKLSKEVPLDTPENFNHENQNGSNNEDFNPTDNNGTGSTNITETPEKLEKEAEDNMKTERTPITEVDINQAVGFNGEEEKFENVNVGPERDIKIGIRLWKKRKGKLYIPYTISNKFSSVAKYRLRKFIRKMNSYLTCNNGKNVWIKKKKKHKKYVEFTPGSGCAATVGKGRFNKQHIWLADACIMWSEGVVLHEMLHTMGFYHEMQRGDRDKYLRVHLKNVKKGTEFNFKRLRTYLTSPYDFNSIMHYPLDAFSKNKELTMVPKMRLVHGTVVGQRDGLSRIDIAQVNGLYQCGKYPRIIPSG